MKRVIGAATAAVALMCASSAGAVTLLGTASGVVSGYNGGDVYDTLGLFGSAGATLKGKSFVVTSLFDSDKGSYVTEGNARASLTSTGNIPGFAVATITIDGITQTITSGGATMFTHDRGTNQLLQQGVNSPALDLITIWAVRTDGQIPFDLFSPNTGNYCQGARDCLGNVRFGNLFFQLALNEYTVERGPGVAPDPTSAVPEPSAWALLIAGFGLAGSALRRARLGSRQRPLRQQVRQLCS